MSIDFVTIKKLSELTGYSPEAIRTNIKRGKWPEGQVWVKNGGRILIWVTGYNRWAEQALGSKPPQKRALKSHSILTELSGENVYNLSPPPLI